MNLSPSGIKRDLTCSMCGDKHPGIWRMVGYDQFGEIWICPTCWEKHKTDPYLRDVKEVYEQQELVDGSL